ncbi:MAG: CATRA conflict system CASPASE/TPR repeat-associated protein [Hyphomicrobiaceae bacterium]
MDAIAPDRQQAAPDKVYDVAVTRLFCWTTVYDDGHSRQVNCSDKAKAGAEALIGRLHGSLGWGLPAPIDLRGSGRASWAPAKTSHLDGVWGTAEWMVQGDDLVVRLAVGWKGEAAEDMPARLAALLPTLPADMSEEPAYWGCFALLTGEFEPSADPAAAASSLVSSFFDKGAFLWRDVVRLGGGTRDGLLIGAGEGNAIERLVFLYPHTPAGETRSDQFVRTVLTPAARVFLKAKALMTREYGGSLKPALSRAQETLAQRIETISEYHKTARRMPLRRMDKLLADFAGDINELSLRFGSFRKLKETVRVSARNLEALGATHGLSDSGYFSALTGQVTYFREQLDIDQVYYDVTVEQAHSALQALQLKATLYRAKLEKGENALLGVLAVIVGASALLTENVTKALAAWGLDRLGWPAAEPGPLKLFAIQFSLMVTAAAIMYLLMRLWQR